MDKRELSTDCKKILLSLHKGEYPSRVPDEDYDKFTLLEVEGLVTSVKTKGVDKAELHAPRLTEEGLAYITANPTLSNPSIWDDKKYLINTIVSLAALAVAIIALLKK